MRHYHRLLAGAVAVLSALLLTGPPAGAQCGGTSNDFETALEVPGATMGGEWVRLGPSQTFDNEPSPTHVAPLLQPAAAYCTVPISGDIDFDPPVNRVSLFYTSCFPVTLEAFDAGGNSLGVVNGPVTDPDGTPFTVWEPIEFETTDCVISAIVLTGIRKVDDLEFCCVPPPPTDTPAPTDTPTPTNTPVPPTETVTNTPVPPTTTKTTAPTDTPAPPVTKTKTKTPTKTKTKMSTPTKTRKRHDHSCKNSDHHHYDKDGHYHSNGYDDDDDWGSGWGDDDDDDWGSRRGDDDDDDGGWGWGGWGW